MSNKHIVRYEKGLKDKTDWARVRAMSDEDIDYSDIPETDAKFWASAKLVMPETRKSTDIGLDSEVIDWFKKQGPDYPRKISAVLKTYIEAQEILAVRKSKRSKAS